MHVCGVTCWRTCFVGPWLLVYSYVWGAWRVCACVCPSAYACTYVHVLPVDSSSLAQAVHSVVIKLRCVPARVNMCVCVCVYVCIWLCKYAHMHTCTHAHMHTHTCTHACTHEPSAANSRYSVPCHDHSSYWPTSEPFCSFSCFDSPCIPP